MTTAWHSDWDQAAWFNICFLPSYVTKLRRPTQEPRVIWQSIDTHIALLGLDTTFDLSNFVLDEAREISEIVTCDLAYWLVLQLDSNSTLAKLVRLIDSVEVERLVTTMGRSGVKDCSASDVQWAVIPWMCDLVCRLTRPCNVIWHRENKRYCSLQHRDELSGHSEYSLQMLLRSLSTWTIKKTLGIGTINGIYSVKHWLYSTRLPSPSSHFTQRCVMSARSNNRILRPNPIQLLLKTTKNSTSQIWQNCSSLWCLPAWPALQFGQSPILKWKTSPNLKRKKENLNENSSNLKWEINTISGLRLVPALVNVMAVEYSISKILGRHQNSEYFLILQKLLEKYSKNTSEVLSGN